MIHNFNAFLFIAPNLIKCPATWGLTSIFYQLSPLRAFRLQTNFNIIRTNRSRNEPNHTSGVQ